MDLSSLFLNIYKYIDKFVSKFIARKKPDSPVFNVTGDDVVISQGQQGGQTAHTINNHAPQREITVDQRNKFVEASTGQPGRTDPLPVRLNDGSNEGRHYLQELLYLLSEAGWIYAQSQGEMANTLPSFEGLRMEVGDISNLPVAVQSLKRAFESAGIQFQITRGPSSWNSSDFRLVIGAFPSVRH
jgi:hypothetical protein